MLAKRDWEDLLLALGKHRAGRLTEADESSMRRLIGLEYPTEAVSLPLEQLVRLGWGMASVPFLRKAMGDDVDIDIEA